MNMNYKDLSDYELCFHKSKKEAIEELWKRYNKLIYKYAHTFHNSLPKHSVQIEDVIQDFNFLFIQAIHKIDLDKIKDKQKFKIIMYVPYFFRAYQNVLRNHYKEELLTYDYNNYDIDNNEIKEFDCKLDLFNSIQKILTQEEYYIISSFYLYNFKKNEIAKKLKISNPLVSYKIKKILLKIRENLKLEKEYLFSY